MLHVFISVTFYSDIIIEEFMQKVCSNIILMFLLTFLLVDFTNSSLAQRESIPSVKAKKSKSDSKKATVTDPTLAKIGNENLTLKEFERQFIRNNGGTEAALKSTFDDRKDFLNLLVKYRLKVLEAKSKGYDKDPDIKKELTEYRQSLATPYLIERELIDPNIKKLYGRRLEDVRVSHVLIRMITDSLGVADTAATYAKAMDVLNQAKTGVAFDSLAKHNSADRQSAERGGDLGFFTAGMTLPVFDDVVYSMKVGELYSTPVRTPFGYHIVKMTGRMVGRGRIRTSHILARLPVENPGDTAAAYAKISLILDTLRKGGSFEELATRNSEDPSSAPNGGDLGFSERRRLVPQYEEAAYALKKGEVSGVVRSPFGYHIIKLVDEASSKSFEEQRQELKDVYQRYGYQQDHDEFIENIKKAHQVTINFNTIDKLLSQIDSSATTSTIKWDSTITQETRALPLIAYKDGSLSIQNAIEKIGSTQDLQSKPLNRNGLISIADKFAEMEAMAAKTKDLEKKYPDFGQLMHEYEEGVLLFRAEQEAVWNRVAVNDTMLQAFWDQHKDDYKWPDRVGYSEIFVTSDSLANVLLDSVKAGKDFAELAAKHTQRSGYREKKGLWGLYALDANDLAKEAAKMNVGQVSDKIKYQYGFSIIKVDEKDPSRTKTFKEAASEVSSKVQESESKRIEREWIDSLKKKFGVTENPDVLKKAFADLKPVEKGK